MGQLFEIRNEVDLSEWTSIVVSDGTISQSVGSAQAGTGGGVDINITTPSTAARYLRKTWTALGGSITDFRLRWYWDRQTLLLANNNTHNWLQLYENTTGLLRAHLRFTWGNTPHWQIRGTLRNDAGTEVHSSYVTIGDTWPSFVEVHIHKATNGTGSNDGFLRVYFDGSAIPAFSVNNIDLFDNFGFNELLIGHVSLVDSTLTGSVFLDEVVARDDDTVIGPYVAPPATTVPDPPTNLNVQVYSAERQYLTWTAPIDDGGSPITGYKIERESPTGNGFVTIVPDTGDASTLSVNSFLQPNTQYNYRVSTITAIGTSVVSAEASGTTPQKAIQSDLAMMSWASPFFLSLPPFGTGVFAQVDGQQILGLPISPVIREGNPFEGVQLMGEVIQESVVYADIIRIPVPGESKVEIKTRQRVFSARTSNLPS